jgi:DNA polymerase III sliding clamp (beta) subunit (PCNA family)
MKTAAKTGALKAAAVIARRCIDLSPAIPILGNVLLEATADRLTITGHCGDGCSTGWAPAEVAAPGATAVPSDRLRMLLEALDADDQIDIESVPGGVTARRGRSHWRLPAVAATDFPAPLELRGDVVQLWLPADEVQQLCSLALAAGIGDDFTRMHLCGVFLHSGEDGRLAAVATDGTVLVRRQTSIRGGELLPPHGTTRGVLIPRRARAEILWLGGKAGCTLSITDKIIEARTEAGCFRSKLLDYVFPTYDHIIPPVPASTIEADSDVLMAALARLVAASHALGGRPPIVGLAWPGEDAGTATLELVREEGIAADAIAVTAVGAGAVALPAVRFGQLIDALALKRARIGSGSGTHGRGDCIQRT